MSQNINQLNVSITTNRTCTLKCNHCYIEPELFKDKSQMDRETFKAIFDQVEKLVLLDDKLQVVEWEAIGGETTMMPFEWWEEMLPIALERIAHINKITAQKGGRSGGLNFLSNLIYRDKRYTALFQKYKDHPLFYLYTSWEPDTNRFGNNDKMYPKFISTLEAIGSKRVILDLILTKTLVTIEPKEILDTFTPLGVNDFSIKMLSPFGSGKAFFKDNMTDFSTMSKWVAKFYELSKEIVVGDREVRMTPTNELEGSLWEGSAFQCNGGFKYDLSIEPNGETHFNANQTGDDKALGFEDIHITDLNWAEKVLFENKTEESRKFHTTDPRCYTCEYMRYCCGGWYHYRSAPFEQVAEFARDECQGMKYLWDTAKAQLGKMHDHTLHDFNQRIGDVIDSKHGTEQSMITESDLTEDYDSFLAFLSKKTGKVRITHDTLDKKIFGKDCYERVSAYCDSGISVVLEGVPSSFSGEQMVYHYVTGNLKHLELSSEQVTTHIRRHCSTSPKLNVLAQIHDLFLASIGDTSTPRINAIPIITVGKVDERYYEAIQFFTRSLVDVSKDITSNIEVIDTVISQEKLAQNIIC